MQQRQWHGFLVWEWLIALALLGGFALLVIAFFQRQQAYAIEQEQLRDQARQEAIQAQRAWLSGGHRLLFELQEGI